MDNECYGRKNSCVKNTKNTFVFILDIAIKNKRASINRMENEFHPV